MKVMVAGLGKLGLPIAAKFAESGYDVIGYDKSELLVAKLRDGSFLTTEPDLMRILDKTNLTLEYYSSIDLSRMNNTEVIFIVVPTPSLPDGSFSNEFILETLSALSPVLKMNKNRTAICVVSTVMPGSCDGDIKTLLELVSGEQLGVRLGLCYHPEFIALGSVIKNLEYPDFHLLGFSHTWAADLVQPVIASTSKIETHCVRLNLIEAEFVKIAINNFITMKIAFANSLMQLTDRYDGINIHNLTNAIGLDSRIGSKYLTAGAPFGGPCFPRDTRALSSMFKSKGILDSYADLTSKLNDNYTDFLIKKIISFSGQSKNIGIIGISYKPGTSVIDESPAVKIANALFSAGYNIFYWDDEGAAIPQSQFQNVNLNEMLTDCDFFVISRETSLRDKIDLFLKHNGKNYIDLWNLNTKNY
jgi:UDPglucose 6-dehydrogenase